MLRSERRLDKEREILENWQRYEEFMQYGAETKNEVDKLICYREAIHHLCAVVDSITFEDIRRLYGSDKIENIEYKAELWEILR